MELDSHPPTFQAPWHPFLVLIDRNVILHALVVLVGFGASVLAQVELPFVLTQSPYGLSPSILGVMYLPENLAAVIGAPLGGKLSDYSARRQPAQALQRLRLNNWIMVVVLPASLVLLGWGLQLNLHLGLLILSLVLLGFSSSSYLPCMFSFLTHVKQQHAATATAGLYSLMFIVSGVIIVVASQLLRQIGAGPFFTALAGVQLLLAAVAAFHVYKSSGCAVPAVPDSTSAADPTTS